MALKIWVALALVLFISACTCYEDLEARYNVPTFTVREIAIIGFGTSGLIAAKHALDQGFNVTIYEQNNFAGGLWSYTDETGKDKYGNDIQTPMYKGLR